MSMPYRWIHLDFHTSEHIPGVGSAWDRKSWQDTLQRARVNGITVFAVCHHGWSYYNTGVGKRHPHLQEGLDLTRAMLDACREIGVRTQVYVTAGANSRVGREHPEWCCIDKEGRRMSPWGMTAGFHSMCFNTPYLDFLCEEVREVASLFADSDGLWLDIIHKPLCHCQWCTDGMLRAGLDPKVEADCETYADSVLQNYYRRTLAALREKHETMRLFQNSGNLTRGDRRFFGHVTHLELESLPTGGWGYDHFPMSAAYARLTGLEFLGMTGKFHTTWGEFGGFKHPNALRYECAAMLASGARCSVGDQLHPDGRLDESTYNLIGEAYSEVAAKEPWCVGARNVADVGLLSCVALDGNHKAGENSDVGASRLLLEGHILFDILDSEMEFSPYKLIMIPDEGRISPSLKKKLDAYLAAGGQALFTGRSPLDEDGRLLFDIGAETDGKSRFSLAYVLPMPELRPTFAQSPMVMYGPCPGIRITTGRSLGDVFDPYFERSWRHFCSHQHAPQRREATGYACGVERGNLMWLPMDICQAYSRFGQVTTKQFALNCVRRMLGDDISLRCNLPSTARATLTEQEVENRFVLHLLHPNLAVRGSRDQSWFLSKGIEVIEDFTQCCDVRLSLRLHRPARSARLEPQGRSVSLNTVNDRVEFTVDRFECHQMVVLETSNAPKRKGPAFL